MLKNFNTYSFFNLFENNKEILPIYSDNNNSNINKDYKVKIISNDNKNDEEDEDINRIKLNMVRCIIS